MGLLEFIESLSEQGGRGSYEGFSPRDLKDNQRWRNVPTGYTNPKSDRPQSTNYYIPEADAAPTAMHEGLDRRRDQSDPWSAYDDTVKNTLVQNAQNMSIPQMIEFLNGAELRKTNPPNENFLLNERR